METQKGRLKILFWFVGTRDTLVTILFKNGELSMEADILTLAKILTPETASVDVPHMYVTIKTTLNCPVVVGQRVPLGAGSVW